MAIRRVLSHTARMLAPRHFPWRWKRCAMLEKTPNRAAALKSAAKTLMNAAAANRAAALGDVAKALDAAVARVNALDAPAWVTLDAAAALGDVAKALDAAAALVNVA